VKVLVFLPGPATHSVVRHGLTVARLVAASGGEVTDALYALTSPPRRPRSSGGPPVGAAQVSSS